MPPWVVFVALITGVAGLIIGNRKGHPVWGFFMGFLLSLIGLVILAIATRNEKPRPAAVPPAVNAAAPAAESRTGPPAG